MRIIALAILLIPTFAFALGDETQVDDVVVMMCADDFVAQHGKKPCEKIKFNEKNIVSGKWWQSPVKQLKGFDGITGRTQFYSKNAKSQTGTVYHTIYVNGQGFKSSHKMERSGNFNGGKWKRLK